MNFRERVEQALEALNRPMSWLANELDMTPEGLKISLDKETVKLSALKKMHTVLNMPLHYYFEHNMYSQSIRGDHNTQQSHSSIAAEPATAYKLELEFLREKVTMLEKQVGDKEEIITLLKTKQA